MVAANRGNFKTRLPTVIMADDTSEECLLHFEIDGVVIPHIVPTTHVEMLYEDKAFRLRYMQEVKNMHADLFSPSSAYQTNSAEEIPSDTQSTYDMDTLPEVAPQTVAENSSEITHAAENLSKNNEAAIKVWLPHKKYTSADHDASAYFLTLQNDEKHSKRFADKKSIKIQIWQEIAQEMFNAGYDVGLGKEGAERCRQKFQNMQKLYMEYKKHVNTTGKEKKEAPPHYDALEAILGDKHKTVPPLLLDSLGIDENFPTTATPNIAQEESSIQAKTTRKEWTTNKKCTSIISEIDAATNTETESDTNTTESEIQVNKLPKVIKNRYSTIKSSVRSGLNRTSDEVIEKIHNASIIHMTSIETLLKEQNEQLARQTTQRDRMISLLESMNQPKQKKKRKHSSDSSD